MSRPGTTGVCRFTPSQVYGMMHFVTLHGLWSVSMVGCSYDIFIHIKGLSIGVCGVHTCKALGKFEVCRERN